MTKSKSGLAILLVAFAVCSSVVNAGGATEKETLKLSVSSDKTAKTLTLVFTANDTKNCRYHNTLLTIQNPKPRTGIGIPTPPVGGLSLETTTGRCQRFADKSHGEISLAIGDELPQIRGGYWAIQIDGKMQGELLHIGDDADVSLMDAGDLPQ